MARCAGADMFMKVERKPRKARVGYDAPRTRKPRPGASFMVHATMSLIITVLITVGLWYLISREWTWQPWILCWLAAINVTALGYYGFDKSRARRSRQRVPEVVLLGLAVFGGSAGAAAGMHLFKHKTVKGRFQIIFWTVVLVQLGLVAVIVRQLFFIPPSAG